MSSRLVSIALVTLLLGSQARGDVILEVVAGKTDRVRTPVSVPVPDQLKKNNVLTLTRLDSGVQVPVQVITGKSREVAWILEEPMRAGSVRRYKLAPSQSKVRGGGVSVKEDHGQLKVAVGDKPVLVYNTAVIEASNRAQSYYDRSGHIHPLYNPRGEVVTDDFAPDHAHQHGLMFPWTKTTFQGRALNFWDQQNGKSQVRHEKVESVVSGPVFGGFTVRISHVDLSSEDSPEPVFSETWRVRVYNLSEYFLFDLESAYLSVGPPVQIEKYHYGGLAIRGNRNWLQAGQGDFLTNENKTRSDGNHTRPHWCDIHGLINGKTSGVTIMCNPSNFRSPQPVRLHPTKPYFCYAPMVLGKFKIDSDKPYVSRYRFYVHNEMVNPIVADRLYSDLAEPIVVHEVDE